MATNLTLEQIFSLSEKSFRQLLEYCENVSSDKFFAQPADKWSIAQNVQHLIISTKTTTAAYALPKFLVRLIGGKPNRPSRSLEELTAKYRLKLQAGGKAKGRYVPSSLSPAIGKHVILNKWQHVAANYLEALKKNWKDDQLDQYIAPHPLLGKITLRELCYFTIYHTGHHLHIIQERNQ